MGLVVQVVELEGMAHQPVDEGSVRCRNAAPVHPDGALVPAAPLGHEVVDRRTPGAFQPAIASPSGVQQHRLGGGHCLAGRSS